MRVLAWMLALSVFPFTNTFASIADDLNRVRLAGCEGRPGAKTALRESKEMNDIAREWSRGGRLRDAIKRTNHRLERSASMHVEGGKSDSAIVTALVSNSCESIVDPAYTHIGVHRAKNEVWVVVGTPLAAPNPGDAAEVSARALRLVNAARSRPRKCGETSFPAAAPLRTAQLLERAALAHAQDMAKRGRFDHVGSDGSRPADRVARVGYKWRTVAENIATGSPDVESVVQGWLDSPGHCANIMGAQYTEMGIAYFVDMKSDEHIYWVQVFGSRR